MTWPLSADDPDPPLPTFVTPVQPLASSSAVDTHLNPYVPEFVPTAPEFVPNVEGTEGKEYLMKTNISLKFVNSDFFSKLQTT